MLSLHDVEMDLRPEARKVMSVFSTEARMKKINIQLLFAPTLDLLGIHSIKTDPVRLGQVVTNLISNAIRFTSNSDVREITVTYNVSYDPPTPGSYECPGSGQLPARPDSPVAEDTPVYLYVSVRDTGPGMSPKEKDVLFQRFHREYCLLNVMLTALSEGNKMIHTRYGGSGLGLFICRSESGRTATSKRFRFADPHQKSQSSSAVALRYRASSARDLCSTFTSRLVRSHRHRPSKRNLPAPVQAHSPPCLEGVSLARTRIAAKAHG
jgi:hypothetical protein